MYYIYIKIVNPMSFVPKSAYYFVSKIYIKKLTYQNTCILEVDISKYMYLHVLSDVL